MTIWKCVIDKEPKKIIFLAVIFNNNNFKREFVGKKFVSLKTVENYLLV